MSNAIKSQGTYFYLSNQDASLTAYGSATFAALGETSSIGEPSGEAADIDVTHLLSTAKEYLIGLPDNGNMQVGGNYVPTDTGQLVAIAAMDAQTPRWAKWVFSSGATWSIKVFVKKFAPSAQVDGKVPFSMSLRTTGSWTRA